MHFSLSHLSGLYANAAREVGVPRVLARLIAFRSCRLQYVASVVEGEWHRLTALGEAELLLLDSCGREGVVT